VHDNFFELGGDSILSIQIVGRAQKAGLRFTPAQLFQHQTIAALVAQLDAASAVPERGGEAPASAPLTPIQRWFFERGLPEPHHFNQAVLLAVREPLDPAPPRRALAALIAHHAALRTRFVPDSGETWQAVDPPGEAPLAAIDLSALPETLRSAALEGAAAGLQASLDLERGPLVRAAAFHLGADRPGRLLLIAHHLVVDGVSWRILLEDLAAAWEGAPLPPRTTSFAEWAETLADHARRGAFDSEVDGWVARLGAGTGLLPLDFAADEAANTVASARSLTVELGPEETRELLREAPAAWSARIDELLLTALGQAFASWTGRRTLLVDLEGHGREEIFPDVGLSRTVGWFTALYPVLLDLRGTAGPEEAVAAVRERLRAIPRRGVGWGVLRYLRGAEPLRALPRAEVSFNYLGQLDEPAPGAAPFQLAQEPAGPVHGRGGRRSHAVEVNGVVVGGRLRTSWTWSARLHRESTIRAVADAYAGALRELAARGRPLRGEDLSPADFPLMNLSRKGLEKLLQRLETPPGEPA
jgi:non-ribosomal peptide synthase protein (TIGR01720 family)